MNPRILVVDDEPQIRRVIKASLAGHGYTISESRTAEEALGLLGEQRFDLALLDYNLPGMSGLDACRAMRKISDMAIILLTVRESEKDKVAALDAGADDYITKPFNTPELLARIRAALRRVPPDAGASAFRFGDDLEIDLATRRVTAQGKPVHLTPKEFDLLSYLLAHADKPVPHGKLLQAVWGPEYGGEIEYLRVFINQLRKKIEADPSKPKYLVTEPWLGYRFALPPGV